MNNALIGQWMLRVKGQRPVTRAHLVESVVADRAVMRCGREMHETNSAGVLVKYETESTICKVCLS